MWVEQLAGLRLEVIKTGTNQWVEDYEFEIPELGRIAQTDTWSSLASQPSLFGKF